ncbi:MAG: putative zinc-binding protein [Kosmotogaceae bacterium]
MSIGILPCQVSSNTGVMTGKITLDKVNGNIYKTLYTFELPLGIEGIIKNGTKNEKLVTLNIWPTKCASKALNRVNIKKYEEIDVTELGIQKNGNIKDETGTEKLRVEMDTVLKEMDDEI